MIFHHQVLQSGTLEIRSTEAVDAGMYQCMVNNEAGEDIKDTWLQVRGEGSFHDLGLTL